MYLENIFTSRLNIHYSVFGKTLPMHCTGCGKAILSHLSQPEIDRIIEVIGLERFTPATITDYDQLMEELRVTRERGYAIDLSEESHGVKCVAAPLMADIDSIESTLLSEPASKHISASILGLLGLLSSARIMSRFAMLREETRGGHFRADFPLQNDEKFGAAQVF